VNFQVGLQAKGIYSRNTQTWDTLRCPLNITIVLHIFVNLLASVASDKCTFNVLKQVKNYYCSTMGQDVLNGFVMINVNCDLARKLDFSSIMNAFSEKMTRKAFVK
jgi:hypothetical protein